MGQIYSSSKNERFVQIINFWWLCLFIKPILFFIYFGFM